MSPQLVVMTASNVLPAAVALSGSFMDVTDFGAAGAGEQPGTVLAAVAAVVGAEEAAGLAAGLPPTLEARNTKSATTTRTATTTTATWRLRAASLARWASRASSFCWRRRARARSCSFVTFRAPCRGVSGAANLAAVSLGRWQAVRLGAC